MNIVIIDDEKLAIDVLTIMLNNLQQFSINIKGTFTHTKDAFPLLDKEPIDLVFLDMEMMDLHGVDVARYLLNNYPSVQIIFVTAHSRYAVDAFEVSAVDYLLKPVHEKRLIKALKKAEKSIIHVDDRQRNNAFYVRTLGSFQLLTPNKEVVKWRTKKVKELFLYLWMNRNRMVLSSVIKEVLWPEIDEEKSTANLHTAIYHLRRVFKPQGIEQPVILVNNCYQLQVELTSDYEELNAMLDQDRYNEAFIQKILHLCNGDFLLGEEYEWAIQLKYQLKQRILHALESYIQSAEAEEHSVLKLQALQKMLELDEYNEEYMYDMLLFLIKQNKKSDVVTFYQTVKQRLEDELGVVVPQCLQEAYQHYLK